MEDSSRFRVADRDGRGQPRPGASDGIERVARARGTGSGPAAPGSAVFVGNAMKALFETAEVSIRRGDETKVITRSDAPDGLASGAKGTPGAADDELAAALRRGSPAELAAWLAVAAVLLALAGYALLN